MEELEKFKIFLNESINKYYKNYNISDKEKEIIENTNFKPIINTKINTNSYFILENKDININFSKNENYNISDSIISTKIFNDINNNITSINKLDLYGFEFKTDDNANIIFSLINNNYDIKYEIKLKDKYIYVDNKKLEKFNSNTLFYIYIDKTKIIMIIDNKIIYEIHKKNIDLYLDIIILSAWTKIYNLKRILTSFIYLNIINDTQIKLLNIDNNICYNEEENYLIKNTNDNNNGIARLKIQIYDKNIGIKFNIKTDDKNIKIYLSNYLSNKNNNNNYYLEINNKKELLLYENLLIKCILGKYNINDEIIININTKSQIEFIRNNNLLYKSECNNINIYLVEFLLIDYNSIISNLLWSTNIINYIDLKYEKLIKFTDNKNYLIENNTIKKKKYDNISYDNYISSESVIKLNYKYNIKGFEFKIISIHGKGLVGFTKQKKHNLFNNNHNIEFGFYFIPNMRVMIYECNGLFKKHVGGYKFNDKFQIRLNSNNEIEYIKNNILLYKSDNLIVFNSNYYVNIFMNDSNLEIKNIRWLNLECYETINKNVNKLINLTSYNHNYLEIIENNVNKITCDKKTFVISDNFVDFNNIKGIEFQICSSYKSAFIGLNKIDNNNLRNINYINYSIYLTNNNRIIIYEDNEKIKHVGGYNINDIFQIRLNNKNYIEYIRNSTLLYTSKKIFDINDVYLFHLLIYDIYFSIKNIKWIDKYNYLLICAPMPNEIINPTSMSYDITYKDNCIFKKGESNWYSSAISEKGVFFNNKSKVIGFEFIILNEYKNYIIGLTQKYKDFSCCFVNIDYSFYLLDNNNILIYEQASDKGHYGKYKKNDTFQIIYDSNSNTIIYLHNYKEIYKSFIKCNNEIEYYIDISLYNDDCCIKNLKWITLDNINYKKGFRCNLQ